MLLSTYPVEAVQTMSRIATETEKQLDYEIAVSQAKKHIPAIGGSYFNSWM